MQARDLRQRVRDAVEPTIQRMGFDLVAIEWLGNVLRLSIDHELGVNARDCVSVSRAIDPILDEADPIKGPYTLEVSSPGIDRPVQRFEDFVRFAGYRIKVRLIEGYPRRRYTGELLAPEGDEIGIRVDGQDHRFHIDVIERAHLVLTLEEYEALRAAPAASEE